MQRAEFDVSMEKTVQTCPEDQLAGYIAPISCSWKRQHIIIHIAKSSKHGRRDGLLKGRVPAMT